MRRGKAIFSSWHDLNRCDCGCIGPIQPLQRFRQHLAGYRNAIESAQDVVRHSLLEERGNRCWTGLGGIAKTLGAVSAVVRTYVTDLQIAAKLRESPRVTEGAAATKNEPPCGGRGLCAPCHSGKEG